MLKLLENLFVLFLGVCRRRIATPADPVPVVAVQAPPEDGVEAPITLLDTGSNKSPGGPTLRQLNLVRPLGTTSKK